MADERDEQTQVGHQVVPDEGGQETAIRQTQPDPESGAVGAGEGPAAEQTEVFFSRDAAQEQQAVPPPTPPPPAEQERAPESPAEADRMAADQEDPFGEKPHLYALGAFAGAFVVAQILKRITGGDD
jgi:hypothetical protein